MKSRQYSSGRLFVRLLELARPYWSHLGGIFLLGMVAPLLALLTPIPLALVVDSVLTNRPAPAFLRTILPLAWISTPGALLITAAILLIGITLVTYIQSLYIWLLQTYTGERLIVEFRAQLFRHAQRLSLAYHDRKGVTDSVYRIQYDTVAVQGVAINGAVPLLTSFITLAGMVVVTSYLDRSLAFIALLICPLLYLITQFFGARLRRLWDSVKDLDSHAMGVVHEVLSAVRVVKAFGQEGREHQRFMQQSESRLSGQLALARTEATMDLLVGTVMGLGTAAVLVVGATHVRSGKLSLGQLIVVMSYIAQLYEPLRTVSKRLADLQSGLAGAKRAFELLDELPEVIERQDAVPVTRTRGQVEFRKVAFGYSSERRVLRDVDISIQVGTRVGITGRTGSGKTTFISLLLRLYDPESGAILLDGRDLRDYRLQDLRNQFALVLQDPVLFSTTIAENIAYGRPGASMAEVVHAAKLANADDFILGLTDGYDTQVGERGMRLSGGERQRISLARAFLKDAPVLVLDEPTSALDLQTEARVMEAMERLMQGRTTFLIAHHLSTLEGCTVKLCISDGHIHQVAMSPDEVLQKDDA